MEQALNRLITSVFTYTNNGKETTEDELLKIIDEKYEEVGLT